MDGKEPHSNFKQVIVAALPIQSTQVSTAQKKNKKMVSPI